MAGLYEIKCGLGQAGFIEFAKVNFGVARRISPCKFISEEDFTSFQVMEEEKEVFLEYLNKKGIPYTIEEVLPTTIKWYPNSTIL